MTLSEHEELQELLGVYALHALDDDEAELVEAHLATCPRCRAEVDDLREVTAHLAQSGAPAPEGLWDRIAEHIDGAAPPPLRLVAADRESTPAPAPVPIRRAWYRSVPAMAAVALAVVAVLSVQLVRQQGQLDRTEREIAQVLDDADRAVAVFAASDARRSLLRDPESGAVLAVAAVLPSGEGFVRADDLPDLPSGVYQLWGQADGEVVSLAVLDRHGELFRFNTDPETTALMITAEEAPVEASENPPVVIGELA